jgi:hypothetical protein
LPDRVKLLKRTFGVETDEKGHSKTFVSILSRFIGSALNAEMKLMSKERVYQTKKVTSVKIYSYFTQLCLMTLVGLSVETEGRFLKTVFMFRRKAPDWPVRYCENSAGVC